MRREHGRTDPLEMAPSTEADDSSDLRVNVVVALALIAGEPVTTDASSVSLPLGGSAGADPLVPVPGIARCSLRGVPAHGVTDDPCSGVDFLHAR